MDLKNRVLGAKHRIMTVLGLAAAALGEIGGMAGVFPEGTRLHAICGACALLGAALKFPETKPSTGGVDVRLLVALIALAGTALVFAPKVRADDKLPATLCAIGSEGRWCYGFLPTVTAMGIDVRHGEIVPAINIGASLAGTWMPGQLKSITLGLHSGFNGGSAGAPQTWNLGGTLSFLRGYATVIVDWQAVGGNHALIIAPAFGAAF